MDKLSISCKLQLFGGYYLTASDRQKDLQSGFKFCILQLKIDQQKMFAPLSVLALNHRSQGPEPFKPICVQTGYLTLDFIQKDY